MTAAIPPGRRKGRAAHMNLSTLLHPDDLQEYSHVSTPQSAVADAPGLAGLRVVVVEDEAITQMQLRMILTRQGIDIVGTAVNGRMGMDLVRAHQPDLVLMDIKMETNTDGLDATRQLLGERRVCVVMLTAYEDYREEAERIGACGYILKPIDSTTLIPQLVRAYREFNDSNPDLIQ